MKRQKAVWFAVLVVAAIAWSQEIVNQGRPGTQGPWPVTITSGGSSYDAGFTGLVATQPCNTLLSTNTAVGASAIPVPATPLSNRIWVQICNSAANSQSTQCVCAANTCNISVAASSVGDFLNPGDCATYNLGTQDAGVPCCICNAAGQRMPATECAL